MREAGLVIDKNGQILATHVPGDRSLGSLPDSPDLWTILFENRENLAGFAHSHPGGGTPGPSFTDVTTFAAVEAGLGRRLDWWIITQDEVAIVRWAGPERLAYAVRTLHAAPEWVPELRRLSEYDPAGVQVGEEYQEEKTT